MTAPERTIRLGDVPLPRGEAITSPAAWHDDKPPGYDEAVAAQRAKWARAQDAPRDAVRPLAAPEPIHRPTMGEYVRLELRMLVHPKLEDLDLDAFGLYVRAIMHAVRTEQDGALSRAAIRKLGGTDALAAKLVAARLLERDGDGYSVHDFLHYNLSASERGQLREKRSAAGRQGGLQAARNRQQVQVAGTGSR